MAVEFERIKMKKILKITILASTVTSSLSAYGHPDTLFGMSTLISMMPTFYTSDVSSHNIPKENTTAVAQKFIEENRESLEVEVAQGDGEKLDTLATLYDVKEKEVWKNSLQEHYEDIFYKKNEQKKSSFEISKEIKLFVEKSFK